jgi:hypothetical protein
LLILLALPLLFLLLLFLNARRTVYDLFSTDTQPSKLPDEIFGLLHFVTSPDEAGRVINAAGDPTLDSGRGDDPVGGAIAPDKPIAMAWYALGSIAKGDYRGRPESVGGGWEGRLKALRQEYPLVVFSKVRPPCACA